MYSILYTSTCHPHKNVVRLETLPPWYTIQSAALHPQKILFQILLLPLTRALCVLCTFVRVSTVGLTLLQYEILAYRVGNVKMKCLWEWCWWGLVVWEQELYNLIRASFWSIHRDAHTLGFLSIIKTQGRHFLCNSFHKERLSHSRASWDNYTYTGLQTSKQFPTRKWWPYSYGSK